MRARILHAAAAGLALAGFQPPLHAQISPGPLARAHAQLEGSSQCLACHDPSQGDENRREVWVYDKISTETAYSTSSGGVAALILAGAAPVGGGAGGGLEASAGGTSRSQRTLTVVIKFDDQKMVRDFSYRYSSF